MITLLHSHHWITVGTHYAEATAPVEVGALWSPPVVGSTRVYQQCESCGKLQETVLSGHYVASGVPESLDNPL